MYFFCVQREYHSIVNEITYICIIRLHKDTFLAFCSTIPGVPRISYTYAGLYIIEYLKYS